MARCPHSARPVLGLLLACAGLQAQVSISGRVVDENGAGIAGARVELRAAEGGAPVVASSDPAGNFRLNLPAAGEYAIRAERLGFYLYQGRGQRFDAGSTQLTIALNHEQEFPERIDITYSPPAIDLQQPSDRVSASRVSPPDFPPRVAFIWINGLRLEFSGPLAKGRAWFHNGFDAP